MIDEERRKVICTALCATTLSCEIAFSQSASGPAVSPYSDSKAAESWMKALIDAPPAVTGPFHMGKFVDRMYYMLVEIGWQPSGSQKKIAPVSVQKGFVTDLTSIPRIFWSLLPPDGSYAFAAVIHDYLYWFQTGTKDDADLVLRYAMEDLKISSAIIEAIYAAVKYGGSGAWEANKVRRQAGERRILKLYPDRPDVTWSDWRLKSGAL